MLSDETIERYRRMTVSEHGAIVPEMMQSELPLLTHGPPDVVARKFDLIRRQNDERNRRMLEGMARTGRADDVPGDGGGRGSRRA